MANLDGLPPLSTWPKLRWFVAWNVEETVGKRLRKEINQLKKAGREFEHISSSQLRKPQWFESEYVLPFSAWSAKKSKKAKEAYFLAQEVLQSAKKKSECEKAVTTFVRTFNDMSRIETSEREDIYTAVMMLIEKAALKIDVTDAEKWFDEARDF